MPNFFSLFKGLLYRYSWHYRYMADNQSDKKEFQIYYEGSPCEEERSNRCISMFNGRTKLWGFDFHGGLADRLKGMVSVYKVCKEMGKEFKILHVFPFNLDLFIEPNQINWRINEKEVVYNVNAVSPHWLRHSPHNSDEQRYYYWRLKKLFKGRRTQHIYSNALMTSKEEFGVLFNELFKPSPSLQSEIDKNLSSIGGRGSYISLSFRFTHLLGDPIDIYMDELSENDKANLIDRSIVSIEKMHGRYPGCKLLINSDSDRFLSAVREKKFTYIYIVPGMPVHIDQQIKEPYSNFMKTFVDFFMIAGAKRVFLVKLDEMRNSGFPQCAAMAGNCPFEVVTFE